MNSLTPQTIAVAVMVILHSIHLLRNRAFTVKAVERALFSNRKALAKLLNDIVESESQNTHSAHAQAGNRDV